MRTKTFCAILLTGIALLSGIATAEDASALGLRAIRTGEGLQVTWNGKSTAIATATGALLVVREGASRKELLFDVAILQGGTFVFVPRSLEAVEFHLQILADSGESPVEVVRVAALAKPANEEPARLANLRNPAAKTSIRERLELGSKTEKTMR